MTPESTLARHVALAAASIPTFARDATHAALLDTVACMVAGRRSAECRGLGAALERRGGVAEATAIGVASRLPVSSAAIANAALAHWYEWDDLHDVAIIHASAVIWPVLLAVAEEVGADVPQCADDLVAAAVIAYDIAARIGGSVTPHADIGWYATAPGSAVGAAAGAARLLGFNAGATAAAMGLAATAAGLTRQPLIDRVTGKNALCAQTVSAVMTALDLARAGVTGARHWLSGRYGFNALMAGGRADPATALHDLGTRFSVSEMSVKPFPCCRATHQSIDLALQLRARYPAIGPTDVRYIEIDVAQPTFDLVGNAFDTAGDPRLSALFSIPYTVSLALLQGTVGLDDFDARTIMTNAAARGLAQRVHVRCIPLKPGEGQYDPPTRMRCTFASGDIEESSTAQVYGSPAHPVGASFREQKLKDCARGALDGPHVQRLARALSREAFDLRSAMSILRGARHGAGMDVADAVATTTA